MKQEITPQLIRDRIRKRWQSNGWPIEENKIAASADEAFKAYNNTRTLKQNAYLWAVPYKILSEAIGISSEDVHCAFTKIFLPEEGYGLYGEPVVNGGSTKNLSKKAFSEYWENIQRWSSEKFDLYIPDPNETEMISAEKEAEQNKIEDN